MEASLRDILLETLDSQGAISFEQFMNVALYHPEMGYYTRRDFRIGRDGDFFTASHLGEVFGVLLCKAILGFWERLRRDSDFSITEVGPGMGYLANDILSELARLGQSFRYNLIEINSCLIEFQRERLAKFGEVTRWYRDLEALEPQVGVILCNEIFDSLPVCLFEVRNREIYEVFVSKDSNSNIVETLKPARKELIDFVMTRIPHILDHHGYRSEVSFETRNLLLKISKAIKRGFLVVIDYGYDMDEYYSEERDRGTLLCYFRHRVSENPYENIGLQDMTAHVNFTLLREWAVELGFKTALYQSQGQFLVSLCDEETLTRLSEQGLIGKLKRLILPQGMGESHRVLVLSKGVN